jgi:hypothetical protein
VDVAGVGEDLWRILSGRCWNGEGGVAVCLFRVCRVRSVALAGCADGGVRRELIRFVAVRFGREVVDVMAWLRASRSRPAEARAAVAGGGAAGQCQEPGAGGRYVWMGMPDGLLMPVRRREGLSWPQDVGKRQASWLEL